MFLFRAVVKIFFSYIFVISSILQEEEKIQWSREYLCKKKLNFMSDTYLADLMTTAWSVECNILDK